MRNKKFIVWLFGLSIALVIAILLSVRIGTVELSYSDIWQILIGKGDQRLRMVFLDFRLPRTTIAILIGAALAVSGTIMQGVSRNSLADPGILGINAGAGLMVMLYVFFFGISASSSIFLLPVLALIGASAAALLIFILAYKKQEGLSPIRLVLSGIGVAAGISAAITILTIQFNPQQYQFIATWLAGSIWGTSWIFVLALLPWLVVLLPYVYSRSNVLNILMLSEDTASGLGARITLEQLKMLAVAVGLAAAAVSVSGGIGFVGLIAPHIARICVGARHQRLLPISALFGALLVIIADMLGRSLMNGNEIPVGVVTAVIGAPYFIFLLLRAKV
ncbi:iron ABC transporter permease [Paenibacillus antibioticophila]|uniref:Iron ABC transporter permease n=1 Tax=Paenibacillus antibioticophila TaxID=1274374 RepID=A0A919XPW6_9BACL|nr:iron ABC transporter permease [Paenibacillus antibioticophila]GIO37071.1 iron ABC transporter permease [Paenibacillus antibioticophila]